ncbi:MAG: type II toxin-antitoxin system Phd/YefM family antitoxin [Candidatus Bipolaricaulia bacterium]
MATRITNVSEAREHLTELVRNLDDPIYITVYGKPQAVIVRYDIYESLLEKIEELEDSLDVLTRRNEPDTAWEELETERGS